MGVAYHYPPDANPVVTYLGRLDSGSLPTMRSTAGLVSARLSGGRIEDPTTFPWHLVRYQHLERLRRLMKDEGKGTKSINKALTFLRQTLREAWRLGLVPEDAYRHLIDVRGERSDDLPSGRALEKEEVGKLFRACDDGTLMGLRDGAVIAMMVGAGLRRDETVYVAVEHVSAESDLRIVKAKKRKQREALLQPEALALVLRWISAARLEPKDPVACRIRVGNNIVRKAISPSGVDGLLGRRVTMAGIEACTPHDLRRTFITQMLSAGMDALVLAKLVGHDDPKTTMIYDRRPLRSARDFVAKTKVTE